MRSGRDAEGVACRLQMRARTGPAVGPGIKCIIRRMRSAGKRSIVREGTRTKVITGEIALAQPEGGPIGECKARESYRKEEEDTGGAKH